MLFGLFVLLSCQLAGDIIARAFSLPIPGPVIGMVLLVALLFAASRFPRHGKQATEDIEKTGTGLLAYLGLFFVPAGVGIIDHVEVLAAFDAPLAAVLVLSTLATLIVTVWVFVLMRSVSGARFND